MKKVVYYINQFFAGIGGEEMADQKPLLKMELVGPAMALNQALDAEVVATVICGDNYMGSNEEEATREILELLEGVDFDIFVAGPAFQAGRYVFACGTIYRAVRDRFNVDVYTSMHVENPGVEMFRGDLIIFEGAHSAAGMRKNIKAIANYINKIERGEKPGCAKEEGYFSRGIRHQVYDPEMKTAAVRGIEMLLKKLNGEPYETELPVPKRDVVPIAAPIKDLANAKIALMTTGGIVPVDNPDRIQSASATRWGKYDISNCKTILGGEYKTIHAVFDPAAANAEPNVIMPIDVMKELEAEGKYKELHPYFYSTVGTGTTQAEAERMASEILEELIAAKVDGVIMTSTWGTCTRCGAAMVKVIERAGLPIVQMCNLIPVVKSLGVNKIVPTISIPYPLGDPTTPKEVQHALRYNRVSRALDAITEDIKEPTVFSV